MLTLEGIEKEHKQQLHRIHARFLSHLEAAKGTSTDLYLRPYLKNGGALQEVLAATERLWLGLMMLDRVVTRRGPSLGAETLARFRPLRQAVQESACLFLDSLISFLQEGGPAPSPEGVKEKVADTRKAVEHHLAVEAPSAPPQRVQSLHALVFALEEVETHLLNLSARMTQRPRVQHR